jgi:hypothetical protein
MVFLGPLFDGLGDSFYALDVSLALLQTEQSISPTYPWSGLWAYVWLLEQRLAAAMVFWLVRRLGSPWHEGIVPRVLVHAGGVAGRVKAQVIHSRSLAFIDRRPARRSLVVEHMDRWIVGVAAPYRRERAAPAPSRFVARIVHVNW